MHLYTAKEMHFLAMGRGRQTKRFSEREKEIFSSLSLTSCLHSLSPHPLFLWNFFSSSSSLVTNHSDLKLFDREETIQLFSSFSLFFLFLSLLFRIFLPHSFLFSHRMKRGKKKEITYPPTHTLKNHRY